MSKNKSSVVGWLTLGGVMAVLGSVQCGNTTGTSGTETHWLASCSVDADCGGLRCLCGVCTQDCDDDDACESLADTAVCAPGSTTDFAAECGAEPKLCVRTSDVMPGSGGGSAATNSTDGGSAGGTGGASATGGDGSSTGAAGAAGAAACAAQDARGTGSGDCERLLGVRWNGEACEALFGCDCEGTDCDEISATYEACAQEHAGCFDNQVCTDERSEIVELLNANKSCTDTSDCSMHYVGCGVSEDGCTGAVYSNAELDPDEVKGLTARLSTCTAAFEEEPGGCGLCERVAQPPQCVDDRCIGADACALEKSVMAAFIYDNDACETADDCTSVVVGCGVSEDGCTGAVYLSEGFDRDEFDSLRSALYGCVTDADPSCAVCERESAPAACVEGRCQRE